MSYDLISRQALMEEINNFSMKITGLANTMAITIMEETKKSVAKMIDEQPVVYDVDKIIKHITETGRRYCNSVNCNKNCSDCEHGCLMRAIEKIVKSGGVADE